MNCLKSHHPEVTTVNMLLLTFFLTSLRVYIATQRNVYLEIILKYCLHLLYLSFSFLSHPSISHAENNIKDPVVTFFHIHISMCHFLCNRMLNGTGPVTLQVG